MIEEIIYMSYGKIQEKEIATIKSRTYKLNLSDADVIRLAEKALITI